MPGAFRGHRNSYKTGPLFITVTEGTTSYTFFSINEQRRIRRHITRSSANLVYTIQCNKYNVPYTGETKRHLSHKFGEHTEILNRQQHIDQPTAVSDHLTLPAHAMDNIELVPLELVGPNRDAIREARDACLIMLISKGKTLGPSGLKDMTKFDLFCIRFSIHFSFTLFLSTNHVTYISFIL